MNGTSTRRSGLVRRSSRCLALVAGVGLLAACVPVTAAPPPPSPKPTTTTTRPPPAVLAISTNPALFPAFDPAVTDYVARCTTAPTLVSVEAPPGTTVSVAGSAAKSGRFSQEVVRATGQRFAFTVQLGTQPPSAYNVRCLPTDFPTWTTSLTGPTQAEWYLTTSGSLFATNYPTIFDANGVPIWWGDKVPSLLVDILPDNTLLQVDVAGPVVHQALDGTVIASVSTPNTFDFHDALLLSEGRYLLVDNVGVTADFAPWYTAPEVPPDGAQVLDHVFREVDTESNVIWSWNTSDHIAIAETGTSWRSLVRNQIEAGSPQPGDAFHWNSVDEVSDGFIFSMRHDDAVYKVAKQPDGSMGDVVWKLGGDEPPLDGGTHLTFVDDPEAPAVFAGQHDARWDEATATLTLFDNGSPNVRAPRAVRYEIDEVAGEARLVESVTHPDVPSSNCCGSTRRMSEGNWVTGWGSSTRALITEQQPDGSTVFRLEFVGPVTMYRAIPIPFGQLDRSTLVAAMDVRHP